MRKWPSIKITRSPCWEGRGKRWPDGTPPVIDMDTWCPTVLEWVTGEMVKEDRVVVS